MAKRTWAKIDGVWTSDDGVVIEGSTGYWFPTLGASSSLESDTPKEAMAHADEHYSYPQRYGSRQSP